MVVEMEVVIRGSRVRIMEWNTLWEVFRNTVPNNSMSDEYFARISFVWYLPLSSYKKSISESIITRTL